MRIRGILKLTLVVLGMITILYFVALSSHTPSFVQLKPEAIKEVKPKESLIQPEGTDIQSRFGLPEGFQRIKVEPGSFGAWLRAFPLKSHGSDVILYNGTKKNSTIHAAVLDLDVGKQDLQQCADSIIRLRSEYLYEKKEYDRIHFNFTNGFLCDFSKWKSGFGVAVEGNRVRWVESRRSDGTYESFRRYLNTIFAYSGTLSLEKEMKKRSIDEIQIGDVFIFGGSPGHGVIIMDLAKNPATGDTLFIAAQGYMPAQDMHVLANLQDPELSPWIPVAEEMRIGGFTFTKSQLRSFDQ